jgi:hypothetical protein
MGVPNQSGANSEAEEKNPQQPASFEHRSSDHNLIASRSVSQTYTRKRASTSNRRQIAFHLIGLGLDERLSLIPSTEKIYA